MGPLLRRIVRRRLKQELIEKGYSGREAKELADDTADEQIDGASKKAAKKLGKELPRQGKIIDWIRDNQDMILMIVKILLMLFAKPKAKTAPKKKGKKK